MPLGDSSPVLFTVKVSYFSIWTPTCAMTKPSLTSVTTEESRDTSATMQPSQTDQPSTLWPPDRTLIWVVYLQESRCGALGSQWEGKGVHFLARGGQFPVPAPPRTAGQT